MTINKIQVTFEQLDGTTVGPVRVLAHDKIKTESTCRKQGWDYSDGPRAHTLMGYFAARRAGLTDAPDYPAFMDQVADYAITNDTGTEGVDEDPSRDGSGF